jgi:hypothetical protein
VTLCLYAIVAATEMPVRIAGMRNEPMMIIPAGNIGGVVGHLARVPRPSPRNLRAYHQTLQQLSKAVPALLPVRFGTTLQSEAELVTLLQARSGSFRTALTRVRRRVQMTVRFVRNDGQGSAPESISAVDRSSGTAYLQSRAVMARRLAASEPCVELRRVTQRWIKAEVVDERQDVVSVYHLVPRAAAESYRRAVEAGAFNAELQVTGPFPPFAFADPLSAALPMLSPQPATAAARGVSARRRITRG